MKFRLGALFVATLALAIASSEGGAQERAAGRSWSPNNRDCIAELRRRDPFAGYTDRDSLYNIATHCLAVSTTERGVNAARARFYAGRAYRMLPGQTNGQDNIDVAIRHLEGAVSAGPEFLAPYPPPRRSNVAYFDAEQRAAMLELVQAYRLRGRFAEARERLDRTGRGSLSPDDGAVAYQRAMLILTERGAERGKEDAFGALRPVFIRSTESLSPALSESELRNGASNQIRLSPTELSNGRALLFSLGRELGLDALALQVRDSRDRAQSDLHGTRAIDYLSAAGEVVRVSNWSIGAPENGQPPSAADMSEVFFELGNARLRAAGVAPRLNGPDSDCFVGVRARPTDAASQIDAAERAFNDALRNPSITEEGRANAHWGLGCAALADLPPRNFDSALQNAITNLRRAVGEAADGTPMPGSAGRPIYRLTLADAQFIQNERDDARDNYNLALGALTDPEYRELRSEIYVDIARTHLFTRCRQDDEVQRGCISLRNPSPIDIGNPRDPSPQAAEDALTEALRAYANNGDARIIRTQIYMNQRNWRRAREELDELLRGDDALEDDDPRKSFARYLSSRRETRIKQECLARNPDSNCNGVGNGRDAFNDARDAAMNDQANADYRLQACIAIVMFGRQEDQHFCVASDGRDPQALLLEGMYWLRRAHDAGQGTRQDRWGYALSAFERGSRQVTSSNQLTIYPEGLSSELNIPLDELLRYGERYVRVCAIGLAGDTESASDNVKRYFRLSGMLPCRPH